MPKGYTASYIRKDPVLTEAQKEAFAKEFEETSDSQVTYEQILVRLMKNKGIGTKEAADLTGLNETLFKNLGKPEGNILKRFVISIAVGFQLDVHLTEYILESCGMRFQESSKVDKAYIYLLENCKGQDITYCNSVLRDLGIPDKDMLGELTRNSGKYKKSELRFK